MKFMKTMLILSSLLSVVACVTNKKSEPSARSVSCSVELSKSLARVHEVGALDKTPTPYKSFDSSLVAELKKLREDLSKSNEDGCKSGDKEFQKNSVVKELDDFLNKYAA